MGCGSYTVEEYHGLWNYMHSNSLRQNRKEFRFMMIGISNELKGQCGEHLKQYLEMNPITTRTEPFRYTWKLHNFVSKKLNKKEISYKKALSLYR